MRPQNSRRVVHSKKLQKFHPKSKKTDQSFVESESSLILTPGSETDFPELKRKFSYNSQVSFYGEKECVENCSFLLSDPKIRTLCSPGVGLEHRDTLNFKIHRRFPSRRKGEITLKNGILSFYKHESAKPTLCIELYNIKSYHYYGQTKKQITILAYETQVEVTDGYQPTPKVYEVDLYFHSPDDCKHWMQLLLVELERMADLIANAVESVFSVKNGKNISETAKTHLGCLLERKVHLFELSKLNNSSKLYSARFQYAKYLRGNGYQEKSRATIREAMHKSFRMIEENQLSLKEVLLSTRALDDITILKQELRLIYADMQNSRRKKV
eukprot:snap_masked-scaffold_9-processed-gene-4.19-mRNA-1 protein AED:1.00 eAED:1.00 QI:0/-1/0/0/-1/1/1/0/326